MRNPCEARPSLTLYVPVYIQVAGLSFANLYQLDYATLHNSREKVTGFEKKSERWLRVQRSLTERLNEKI